jgi:NitT/TauT family transport system substrate-binding protein
MAYVALATSTLPTWIADTEGFFKQEGVDPEISYVQGSSTALPALASGNLDIIEAQPAVSVQGQLRGEDTVVLATHIPYADQRIVARAGIKTMDDLKGQSIAVSKPGTVTDNVVRWVLKHYNLTPDQDAKVTYLNSQPGQLAAVEKGLVAATLVPAPYDFIAEKGGAHLLLDVRKLNYAYPVDGVVSTRSFVHDHPKETVAYLKAYVRGVRYARSNPEQSKQILGKFTKQSDPQILDEAYKAQMQDWADPPVPFLEGIKTVLPFYKGGEGKNPADFIDPKPMDQALKELGSAKHSASA